MTQSNPIIGADKNGLQYRTEDNDGKRALLNHHKGSTAPSYAEAGTIWLDDTATPWLMKMHDGTDWITIGSVNATTDEFTPYISGSALGDASETAKGLVEKATDAEASAGTDTERYVTPAQLATYGGGSGIGQGDLNTSVGTVSASNTSTIQQLVLPGGEYGLYPQLHYHVNANVPASNFSAHLTSGGNLGLTGTVGSGRDSGYVTAITIDNPGNGHTTAAKQRYISASPPFDMGDGEVNGFLFLKLSASGEFMGHYLADVPQWAYNGPTSITPCRVCSNTKTKFRKILKPQSFTERMDGAPLEYIEEEITQDIKNADMNLLPHPWRQLEDGEQVVLVDPMDDRILKLLELQQAGEDIGVAFAQGLIRTGSEIVGRHGPTGVVQVELVM